MYHQTGSNERSHINWVTWEVITNNNYLVVHKFDISVSHMLKGCSQIVTQTMISES